MPMVPPNALGRVLTWRDFPKKDLGEPPEGTTVTAAQTNVILTDSGGTPARAKGSSRIKLAAEPTVSVTFPNDSWVAKFVFKWPKGEQDALLDHEQIHYLIAALCARDQLNALKAIMQKDYPDEDALTADVLSARDLADNQAIQDKYDDDTKSLPTQNAAQQSSWAKAVRSAQLTNQPIRQELQKAGLI